jgi:hypothetical protein
MILGGSKMKLMNLIKIAPMVLMVVALSTQARGDEHMRRGINPRFEPATWAWDYPEVRIMVKAPGIPLNMVCLGLDSNELEGWMFCKEYLDSSESSDRVEDWMFETDYLGSESQPVECWMLETGYLESESQPVEDWMLDASYLEESPDYGVESWMMNAGYLSH